MKKILITAFILIFLQMSANAFSYKMIKVISLEKFSTENPTSTFTLQTTEDEKFSDDYILPAGTIISGEVNKVKNPKRGKINGSFELIPLKITYNDEDLDIDLTEYKIKVVGYQPVTAPAIAYSVAKTSVGFFVKGASQGLSFVEGIAKAENGDRLKSGFVNVYKDSPLSYIEEGQPLEVNIGDQLVLKLLKIR